MFHYYGIINLTMSKVKTTLMEVLSLSPSFVFPGKIMKRKMKMEGTIITCRHDFFFFGNSSDESWRHVVYRLIQN